MAARERVQKEWGDMTAVPLSESPFGYSSWCRVDSQLRYMLGKGAKRKHDRDEDGPEGEALADGPSKVSYSLQRQTVFNMSLMKLYQPRAAAEPSLERRVLISNVLRRIQEELRREGRAQPIPLPASPPPENPADEGFREAALPPPNPTTPDSCLTPASLLEADSSLFCTSPSPHGTHQSPPRPPLSPSPSAPKDSFSSALDEIEELCPAAASTTSLSPEAPPHLPPLSPLLPSGADSKDKPCGQKPEARDAPADPHPGMMDASPSIPLSSSSSSTSSGFLTDLALDDILFADIDTSMYDFDPCTSTTGTGAGKIAPVVTADDLVKTLSPYSSTGSTATAPSQPFKMDLAELDHIMEVLVGS